MLYEFLTRERAPILAQCEQEILSFGGTKQALGPADDSWHIFYDELIDLLQRDQPFEFHTEKGLHKVEAEKHGKEYLRLGYTVSEVVHSYGVICQAITDFAAKLDYPITSREFRQLNLSLDTAIAEAVTEFEKVKSEERDVKETERLGFLAHELRNSLQTASISLEMIEGGSFGARSNTGGVLQNSLQRMAELIDTALTEVRMRVEPTVHLQRIPAFEIMSEVGMTSAFSARSQNLTLQMQGFSDLEVIVDRQLVVSALANLVQNGLKFTPSGGIVKVRARRDRDRVLIEVEDQCGGLSEGTIQELFKPFVQKSADRTGVGLGLTISRRAIELCKGTLRVENLPGEGCIFIIDLPEAPRQ
ncbi:MAG TPA: HAMP domain-containing sensor histidine kinase [Candidatus Kapabacteria bacterium]|nr:HAMP domain-containing sensor histidine kinase [Candidatus Kapabacteria bacterium]